MSKFENNKVFEALDNVAKMSAYAGYYDDDFDSWIKTIKKELVQAQKMHEALGEQND